MFFKADLIGENEAKEIYKYLEGDTLDLEDVENAINLFKHQTINNPDAIAVVSNDVSYSYAQLGEKVDAIALHLIDQDVQNGDKIGICLLRRLT